MHLYERYKIDVLGTSRGLYPTDVFSGRFYDVCRTFLQNFKNKEYLTFRYFNAAYLVSRIEDNTTVMCFVLCLKLTSWGRPIDFIETLNKLSKIYFTKNYP